VGFSVATAARADAEGAGAAAEGSRGSAGAVREGAALLGTVQRRHHRRAQEALPRGQLQRVSVPF